jgi:hypothetical protein
MAQAIGWTDASVAVCDEVEVSAAVSARVRAREAAWMLVEATARTNPRDRASVAVDVLVLLMAIARGRERPRLTDCTDIEA